MPSIGTHDDQSEKHYGLFDTRLLAIFMIATNIAFVASAAAGVQSWVMLSAGGGSPLPLLAPIAVGFAVWWLTFLSVAGALHRIMS